MPTSATQLPGDLNLTFYQGATFNVVLTWLADGTAVNLTGYTADMKVRAGQDQIVELSTANGRITLGGSAGTITLTVSATDTAVLPPGTAEYDLLLTSPAGVVTPLVAGLSPVRRGITGGT